MAEDLEAVFDENAVSYDRVNRVISLGMDRRWRRWAARQAVWKSGTVLLDAFAGTGLVGLEAKRLGASVTLVDDSGRMLAVARHYAHERGLEVEISQADLTAQQLPFSPASFDAVTVVFGVRYLADPAAVLRGLAQLLTPGGRIVIVEFVVPEPRLISSAASWYFFRVIPRIAPLLGGRAHLHDTLAETTRALGAVENLVAIAEQAGLQVTEQKLMGFGMVAGLVCEASPPSSGEAGAQLGES